MMAVVEDFIGAFALMLLLVAGLWVSHGLTAPVSSGDMLEVVQ